MPRTVAIRVEKSSQTWRDNQNRRQELGPLFYRGENLILHVTIFDLLGGSVDFTGSGFSLVAKDPENVDAPQFLFDTTDISDPFTDLPFGKVGFVILVDNPALDVFLLGVNCPKKIRVEINELTGGGDESQIVLHDRAFIRPDVRRSTETSTTTTTTTTTT